MRRFIAAVFVAFSIFATVSEAIPQEVTSAIPILNIAQVRARSLGAYIHVQGGVTPGDGGGGYFIRTGLVCTDDGITTLKDSAGHCFVRQNTEATGSNVVSVDTIADMVALGVASPSVRIVYVKNYRATGTPGGGGTFLWNASSTTTPDVCVNFQATAVAVGRWVRQLVNNKLDVMGCGAYFDYPSNNDDGIPISAAFAVANSMRGVGLTAPCGISNIGTQVVMAVGIEFTGCATDTNNAGTYFVGFLVNTTAPQTVFGIQMPNGTAIYEAPKLRNMLVNCTFSFYCIRWNSIAGGFTDTASTQGYLIRPQLTNVVVSGAQLAGIQCSKCFDGDFSFVEADGGFSGIDLQGSDWMSIGESGVVRIVGTTGYMIQLVSHGTFGNGNRIVHTELLHPQASAAAYIYNSARSSVFEHLFFEGANGNPCGIKLDVGGLTFAMHSTQFNDATVAQRLCVDNPDLFNFEETATSSSGGMGGVKFNSGTGNRLYTNAGTRMVIHHVGNQSETGYPFGTTPQHETPGGPKTIFDITPSTELNIDQNNYGPNVTINNNAYQLPNGTPTINFYNAAISSVGTLDLCALASATGGANTLKFDYYDGGAFVATYTFTPGATKRWVCQLGIVVGTSAVFKAYNSIAGLTQLYEVTAKLQ